MHLTPSFSTIHASNPLYLYYTHIYTHTQVYAVTHKQTGQAFACKVVKKNSSMNDAQVPLLYYTYYHFINICVYYLYLYIPLYNIILCCASLHLSMHERRTGTYDYYMIILPTYMYNNPVYIWTMIIYMYTYTSMNDAQVPPLCDYYIFV
jgi:hypothetical protein